MELSHDDVLEILALIERSEVAYLELQVGDTRIVADRDGSGSASRAPAAAPQTASPPAAAPADAVPPDAPAPAKAAVVTPEPRPPSPAPEPAEAEGAEGLLEVTAPVVGVFYRAPEPGAPPFVEPGGQVQEGDTLGLVEVMKMFNSVTAEQAGVVAEIIADNEEFVEFGQVLMTIRPVVGS